MKKISKFSSATFGFFVLLCSFSMKGQATNDCTCPSGYVCCSNNVCAPQGQCPSKVVIFPGEAGILYSLPAGMLFACEGRHHLETQLLHLESPSFPFWTCPSSSALQRPVKKRSFKSEPEVLYSFPEEIAFVCELTNEPPQKIVLTPPAKGFPTVYWACPAEHLSSPSANNGDSLKK